MTDTTKREWFAGMALQGLLVNVYANGPHWQRHPNAIAAVAFKHADAMIAESEKGQGDEQTA